MSENLLDKIDKNRIKRLDLHDLTSSYKNTNELNDNNINKHNLFHLSIDTSINQSSRTQKIDLLALTETPYKNKQNNNKIRNETIEKTFERLSTIKQNINRYISPNRIRDKHTQSTNHLGRQRPPSTIDQNLNTSISTNITTTSKPLSISVSGKESPSKRFTEWINNISIWKNNKDEKINNAIKDKENSIRTASPSINDKSKKLSGSAINKLIINQAVECISLSNTSTTIPTNTSTDNSEKFAAILLSDVFNKKSPSSSINNTRSPSVDYVFDRLSLCGMVAAKKLRDLTPPPSIFTFTPTINERSRKLAERRKSMQSITTLSSNQLTNNTKSTNSPKTSRDVSPTRYRSTKEYVMSGYETAKQRSLSALLKSINISKGKEYLFDWKINKDNKNNFLSPETQRINSKNNFKFKDRVSKSVEIFKTRRLISMQSLDPGPGHYSNHTAVENLSIKPKQLTNNTAVRSPGSPGHTFSKASRDKVVDQLFKFNNKNDNVISHKNKRHVVRSNSAGSYQFSNSIYDLNNKLSTNQSNKSNELISNSPINQISNQQTDNPTSIDNNSVSSITTGMTYTNQNLVTSPSQSPIDLNIIDKRITSIQSNNSIDLLINKKQNVLRNPDRLASLLSKKSIDSDVITQ